MSLLWAFSWIKASANWLLQATTHCKQIRAHFKYWKAIIHTQIAHEHYRGQKYFNFALALQDEPLTIFTRPANTCTRPKKLHAIKKMGRSGGGGGNLMFLMFLISLLKWYWPTAVSFIIASHTLTKRVLHSIILMLWLSFLKIAFTFPFFCRNFRMSNILAEPLFDWFINLLRPSTFSYKEEKSIITAIQSVTIQTYFSDENALRKNQKFLRYSLPHYRALYSAAFIRHLQSQHPVSTFGIEKVFGSMNENASCYSENASFTCRF